MVLIREDNTPRLQWPIGIIVDTYPGRDGIIRTVKVRTPQGEYTRAIQKLHDLEIETEVSNVENEAESSTVESEAATSHVIDKAVISNNNDSKAPEKRVSEETKVKGTTRSGRTVKSPQKMNL